MTVTATNVMDGPITVFHGLFGVAEPLTASATPGAGWTDLGGTRGGATLTLGQTHRDQTVDQLPMPVGGQLTEQMVTVATQLAEVTLANLRRALNQASSAATTLEFGGEDLTNTAPTYSAILLKGRGPGGAARMWIVRRTLSTEGIGVPFQKDGDTVFPVTWKGYYVSASIKAVKIDDTV